jgi:energy-coupling factor transporter ATP-binding protein EcfA2
MKEFSKLVVLEEFWVKNFKSLRNFRVSMPSKLTIVVGANGSGKTALVEVFELLTYMLEWARGLNPNPFLKWWGYSNVVSGHNEDLPITIGFKLKLDDIEGRIREIKSDNVREVVRYSQRMLTPMDIVIPMDIVYEVEVSGKGGGFHILRENLSIISGNKVIEVDTARNSMTIVLDVANELTRAIELINRLIEVYGKRKELERFLLHHLIAHWGRVVKAKSLKELRRRIEEVETIVKVIGEPIPLLLTTIAGVFTIASTKLELTCEMKATYSIFNKFIDIVKDVEGGISNPQDSMFDEVKDFILGGRCLERLERHINERLVVNTSSPVYQQLISRNIPVDTLLNFVKGLIAISMVGGVLFRVSHLLFMASAVVYGFVEGIAVVKNIDWRMVTSPQVLERSERLRPDASNFLQFLFTTTGGNVGEDLREALRYSLPGYRDFNVVFEPTADGRVFARLVVDGLRLAPISIPYGTLKTLIIGSLLEWEPSLLVVDEFENSLHPELQQFLLDEFRSSGVNVIVTTHSTIPLDYARSPDEVLVLKLVNGETVAYRLGREVLGRMREKKLTLSELLLSGLLRLEG